MSPQTFSPGTSMADAMREAASCMSQASALEKEIFLLEKANPADSALAFRHLNLGHLKDQLGEHSIAAEHYERAAELYLVHNRVAVASSTYFNAGKALYLSKDSALQFKALTLLKLAQNLDQATSNKNQEERPESHYVLETLIAELSAPLNNHK